MVAGGELHCEKAEQGVAECFPEGKPGFGHPGVWEEQPMWSHGLQNSASSG